MRDGAVEQVMAEAFPRNTVSDGGGGDDRRLDLALGKLNSCHVWFSPAGDGLRGGGSGAASTDRQSLFFLTSPNLPIHPHPTLTTPSPLDS